MRNDLLRAPSFFALALLVAAPLAGCGAPTTTGELLTKSGQVSASGPIAVGASGIFFLNTPDWTKPTTLSRIPLAGGAPVTLDPDPAAASWMLLDTDSVFYGGSLPPDGCTGPWTFTISRVPQSGGAPETLITGPGTMAGMAVGGGRLAYVTQIVDDSEGFDQLTPGTGTLFVQPIAPAGQPPSAPVTLAKGLPQPCALAADDARVYWLDCSTGSLLSLPFSPAKGQAPTTLAAGLAVNSPLAGPGAGLPLTVAAGQLYWFEGGDFQGGDVRTMPAAGGTPSTIASESDWSLAQLMADATAVYWMTASNYSGASGDGPDVNDRDPGLWTAPAGGGSVSQVLGEDASPTATAMDAGFLYWASDTDGSLRRVAR